MEIELGAILIIFAILVGFWIGSKNNPDDFGDEDHR